MSRSMDTSARSHSHSSGQALSGWFSHTQPLPWQIVQAAIRCFLCSQAFSSDIDINLGLVE